jgi:hypothetical protein
MSSVDDHHNGAINSACGFTENVIVRAAALNEAHAKGLSRTAIDHSSLAVTGLRQVRLIDYEIGARVAAGREQRSK